MLLDRMGRTLYIFSVLFFLLTGLGHCGETITVASASSLAFVLKEISQRFEEDTGIKVVLSFGSTGLLSHQIENGAPFDVFFSANNGYMERLIEKDCIHRDTLRTFARGQIVLVVNKDTGLPVRDLKDIIDQRIKRIAIATPLHAPYGIAAKEALVSTGLWDRIKHRIIYGENIRQTLQFVQTGNAPVGIVALAIADVPEVYTIPIDPSLYAPIDQTVAVVKRTKRFAEARRFIEFLYTDKGRTILRRYGFSLE